MRTLYIVDDDYDILLSLSIWFKKMGFEAGTFENSKTLFDALKNSTPDLIILDINLKGEDGRDICKQIKTEMKIECPIILFSANYPALDNITDRCADGILHKPFDLPDLLQLVKSHVPIEENRAAS